jgi:hypothetical protein
VRVENNWTQAEMPGGESKSSSKEPRKIIPKPRRNLTGHGGAEHVVKSHKETRPDSRNRIALGNSR